MLFSNDKALCVKALANHVPAFDRTSLPREPAHLAHLLQSLGAQTSAAAAGPALRSETPDPGLDGRGHARGVVREPEHEAAERHARIQHEEANEVEPEGAIVSLCNCSRWPALHAAHD